MCVEPVASGYSNSPCLIAGGHLSATSGSAQASCKAWAPTSVKGALEAACAAPCSSLVRCSRWLQAEMTSAMVQCLSGQEPVSEFEPSFLKEGQMLKSKTKHIRTNPRINSTHNNHIFQPFLPVPEKICSSVESLQAFTLSLLTYVSPPRLDDNGAPAASLLLDLRHAFLGFLVGVVRCTYCNLVLDPSQTIQLNAPFTAKAKRKLWERKANWKQTNIVF